MIDSPIEVPGSSEWQQMEDRVVKQQARIEELEMSLRIIQTWAGCYDPMIETTEKALGDIRNKCIEVLKRT